MKKLIACLLVLVIVATSGLVLLTINKKNDKEDSSTEETLISYELKEEYYEGFPLIEINTQNGELPCDKENYINCSFKLSNAQNEAHNFEVAMAEEYGTADSVGIRLRGNSTKDLEKKPYRIKFNTKKSLFGLKKNKSWVLLADFLDQSSIRNYTAFTLAKKFSNLDFTPTPHHVVVCINGEYKGLYLLTEQVDEESGRTNVEDDFTTQNKSFPFLIEMDRDASKEGVTGVDNFKISDFRPFEIKYPESDERGIEEGQEDVVFNYIYDYMEAVLLTLSTGKAMTVSFSNTPVTFEDLVDVDSFVDYFLITEIMHNHDSVNKSIYMHKTTNGKLKMGPVWDFDYSLSYDFDLPYKKSEIDVARRLLNPTASPLFKAFLQKESNYKLVQNRWDQVKGYIKEVSITLRDYKAGLRKVAEYDALRWYGETGLFQFDMQYDFVRLFLLDRYDYLDEVFDLSYEEFKKLC